jgi:hypothetical protein
MLPHWTCSKRSVHGVPNKSKALASVNNMLIHGHDPVLTTWVCILVYHAFCVPHVLPGNNVSQEQWQ